MTLVTITNPSLSNSDTSDVTKLTQNDNDLVNGITDGTKGLFVASVGIGITPTYKFDISGATSGRTLNLLSSDTTASSYLLYGTKTGAATTNYGTYLNISGGTTNYGVVAVADTSLFRIDEGTLPTFTASTAVCIINNSATSDDVNLALISGSAAHARLNFGDSADDNIGYVDYNNTTDVMAINAGVQITQYVNAIESFHVTASESVFNEGAADIDFRVETLSQPNMLFIDAGNNRIALGASDPAASTILDIRSTTGAVLLPRMTTGQRDALTASNGMIIYNTSNARTEAYENGVWIDL